MEKEHKRTHKDADGWPEAKKTQLKACVAQSKVKIYHQGSNEIVLLGIPASI